MLENKITACRMPTGAMGANQSRDNSSRGRGGNRNRRGGSKTAPQSSSAGNAAVTKPDAQDGQVVAKLAADETDADDGTVCWICAEPVKYWSVSECNHRTCHVCALRLRALYKKLECTFCKVRTQPSVIFTTSPEALWSSYTPDNIPYKDVKLAISFETQEMMEETLILLRFNCPDPDCDVIGNGWSDLKLHTRATHSKLMCDLCIRFKKVFAHEHALYDPNVLPLHLPSMARGYRRDHKQQQVEGGVHPYCEFCRDCFFSEDELYAHMREKHEECFVCKRQEIKDQYFKNYEALEEHFMNAHFPCKRTECLARKFVVFGSALDLKAHMVEEHGAEMSARDKRDARRVQTEFEFEEVGGPAGRRGRRDRGDREREREPPPHVSAPPAQGGAGGRPGAAGARRREAFGGNLTTDGPSTSGNAQQRRKSPSPEAADTDPRFTALVGRLSSLAPNPTAAIPAVKAAIRSFQANESAARDLISTVWNILDRNLDGTASIVNSLVDVIEEDGKKADLLAAWNGFKVEQRNQFPELVPTAIGSEWAGVTSGRVLNAKHSTATRSSAQSSRQLWDRRLTPWAAASAAAPAASVPAFRPPTSVPGPGASSRRAPASLSASAFPELPGSSSAPRVPRGAVGGNQSLKKILGESAPVQPAWKANGASGSGSASTGTGRGRGRGGKKKGKGKQKQTLFTMGSFPT
ncbi:uncharacterized protein BXZ73DRAFT_90601 [Epithele typhae]|uniref:uncharacterized protein n=1 Tax=Epithele typhae TaxID=378194 RepID=UPI00200779AA|nr:uncharacterized protein BXZ73DRAFT_90601 [Epithele typhae]KAH9928554.1 hypothetical protein BXZ73DRAFT_90601 [Epithele typhae]